jgi:hypothetical protein
LIFPAVDVDIEKEQKDVHAIYSSFTDPRNASIAQSAGTGIVIGPLYPFLLAILIFK